MKISIGAIASQVCMNAVRTTESIDRLIAIYADDRAALTNKIREIDGIRLTSSNPRPFLRIVDPTPFLRIVLPCGHAQEWQTEMNVPGKTVQCHCPNLPHIQEHYFIKYGDLILK